MSFPPEEIEPLDPEVLREIRNRARLGNFKFEGAALLDAKLCFGWGVAKIQKCILKLNGAPYNLNQAQNHYWKQVPLRGNRFPGAYLYHFRAINIMEGFSVYTHVFFAGSDLGVSSFKSL